MPLFPVHEQRMHHHMEQFIVQFNIGFDRLLSETDPVIQEVFDLFPGRQIPMKPGPFRQALIVDLRYLVFLRIHKDHGNDQDRHEEEDEYKVPYRLFHNRYFLCIYLEFHDPDH